MILISNFKLNRDKKITTLLKELKSFIFKSSKEKWINNYLKKVSTTLNFPTHILSDEFQIFLFENFENHYGKFNKKFHIVNFFRDSIKIIIFYIYIFIFSKKITNQLKTQVIVDDIDDTNTNLRFNELEKYFKIIYFVTGFKGNKKKTFYFKKFRGASNESFFLKNPLFFFQLFFLTFYYSIFSLNNLFPFSIRLLKVITKYETLFTSISSDFLIQERHFNTSALKNYIYKKNGGSYSCATQRNILQMNGVGMYINTDILFSLGTKTSANLKKYAGKAKKIIPVGSLGMELNYFKRKEKNSLKKYDLIVFASDHNKIFHSGYNSYYREYLQHFDWIKKFAQKHPKFKIGIKLKHVIKDKNVIKLFQDIKNVKILVDRKYLSDSYFYASKSNALCTWSSTLAFEFLGHGRVVYFCDPNYKNLSFLPNERHIKKFKLNNYLKFEKKILEQINDKKLRFYKNKKLQEKFCLNSYDVTKRIYKSLKKIK